MIENLICITCPVGCMLEVTVVDGEIEKVTGNTCKRGDEYARKELVNPTRVVTTTVKVKGKREMLPVKTKNDIPKGKIFDCLKMLKSVEVELPIKVGDVVFCDEESGIEVVATKSVL